MLVLRKKEVSLYYLEFRAKVCLLHYDIICITPAFAGQTWKLEKGEGFLRWSWDPGQGIRNKILEHVTQKEVNVSDKSKLNNNTTLIILIINCIKL